MNINDSIELLKEIINKNKEYRPTNIDNWDDGIIKSDKIYEITDDLIKLMQNYSKIYKQIKNYIDDKIITRYNDKIAIIYLAENVKTHEKYVGYTTYKLFTLIKLNIHQLNIGEDNVFSNFTEKDIRWITFRLLEFIKFENRKEIFERKKYYMDHYYKNIIVSADEKSDNDDDFLFKARMKIYFDIIVKFKNKLNTFTGYIFALVNKENKKIFIGGFPNKISLKDIINILKSQNNKKFIEDFDEYNEDAFELKNIEKYKAYTKIDFILRIDYLKIKYSTIQNGYNSDLIFEDSQILFADLITNVQKKYIEKKLFPMIQKLFFEKDFRDNTDYKNIYGFVYEIFNKRDKKRYFAYIINKSLKDVISDLYDGIIKKSEKYNKIQRAFLENPFYDFEFNIIKIKTEDDVNIDLKTEADLLIAKYDTINNGYNININIIKRNVIIANIKKKQGYI
jgi:hypothetical protein